MTSPATTIRRYSAGVLALGLIAGMGVQVAAEAASPRSVDTAATKQVPGPHSNAASARPAGDADTAVRFLRIWAKTGGRVGVSHGRVLIVNDKGKVLRRVDSRAYGATSLPLTGLPAHFRIKVTGGTTVNGDKQDAVLTIPVTKAMQDHVVFVSPITTIADQVSQRTRTSYAQALQRTKKALGIPRWARPDQFAGVASLFDPEAFHRFAGRRGGHQQAIDDLAARIARGQSVPHFTQKSRARADDPEVMTPGSVAAKLALVAAEAVVWKGTQAVVGKYLPVDPEEAALASQLNQIQGELAQISEQLTGIQDGIDEILKDLSKLSYNTAYDSVSEAVDDIPPLWSDYQQFAANYACPYWQDPSTCSVPTTGTDTYEANATDLAKQLCGIADFSNAGQPMSLFSGLFTSPAGNVGVIPALYQMYSEGTTYWSSDDLDAIFQTIDYFGTIQAQGAVMLNDAWSYIPEGKKSGPCNRPATNATTDMNTYISQNNSIGASLPSGYTYPGIVLVPSNPPTTDSATETILQSFPVQSPQGTVGGKYAPTNPATCSSGTTMTSSQYSQVFEPMVPLLPASQFTSTWEAAVPDGYDIVHSSDLANYQTALTTVGDDSWTGLKHIVYRPSGNIAQAVVTAESVPVASAQWDPSSPYVPEAMPAGISWCNSATLGAAANAAEGWDDASGWVTNFTMTTSQFGDNHVYYGGVSLKNGFSVPLGVLATGPVKAHYVAPYAGAPTPTPVPCVPGQQDCVGDTISEATPMPGTWYCDSLRLCTGLEQANGEMIDDYNDHDVYSFEVPVGGLQYVMNGPVGDLAKEDPCTFCGFTLYNPALQPIMTCPVAADCFTGSAGEEGVLFVVGDPGTYYVDVYRNGTLPNPVNVTYQVQFGADLDPVS